MFTLHVSSKTHRRVLLQPAALEDAVADNQQGTDEAGRIGLADANPAGVQHARGETPTAPVWLLGRHPEAGSPVSGTERESNAHAARLHVVEGRETARSHFARACDVGSSTAGTVQGINHKHCTVLQGGDGYGYTWKEEGAFSPALKDGVSSANF